MTTYAIGDIQGCFAPFEKLLDKIHFDPGLDTLWCTGDLVNRGPQSLEVLRFFKALGDKHRVVLGNHDLHLLAVAAGVREQQAGDTLTEILRAPDRDELLDWLRHRPLLVQDSKDNFVMTHAGLAPTWDLSQAIACAKEVEAVLQGPNPQIFLAEMYGNQPEYWEVNLKGIDRWRCIVNYFTRMRYCYDDGRLNLTYKGDIAHKPEDVKPWFLVEPRANATVKIIFGHWASLEGKADAPNVYALDTGCIWGNCLSAMRLQDGTRFQVPCKDNT